MVIDDDEHTAALAADYLEMAGFEAFQAPDGKAGVEKALRLKPELVLVDLMMPKMHGWQVCERLRAEESTKGIRILVTSSKTFPADIALAMSAGADAYLKKPYLCKDLFDKLREILGPEVIAPEGPMGMSEER
ncbi:MAG: response regulator [Elusimicrobiota bacterium]